MNMGKVISQLQLPLVTPSLKGESHVLYLNGIIMVSRAHNMCKPGLDPIDCKSSLHTGTQSNIICYKNGAE